MTETLENLCKEYTDLYEEEIEEIKGAAKSLPAMANLFNADAFIDCRMSDGSVGPCQQREEPSPPSSLVKTPDRRLNMLIRQSCHSLEKRYRNTR